MNVSKSSEQEINEAISSGNYKVASLDLFQDFSKLEISNSLKDHLVYTKDLLNYYLSEIIELQNKIPGLKEYLNALKAADLVDNQSLEKENSFLIGLYLQVEKENALDEIIRYIKENKELTDLNIYEVHRSLLYGTSSESEELVRCKNQKFVGRFENGKRIIDYFPIDYKECEEAGKKLAKLYNSRLFDNVFLQPFIIHGLFGALQIFSDGNTRMGRLVQHTLMWQLINETTNFNFDLPPLYATRSYYPYRGEYRNKIANLVVKNDSESWDEWFEFNLKRVEDQIYLNSENINVIKRKVK